MLNQPFFAKVEEKFGWKFLKNNWEYFSKIFLKKISDFFGDCCDFRGVIFATRKEKKYLKKMSQLIDPPWKVRLPVKQGLFFSWPKQLTYER